MRGRKGSGNLLVSRGGIIQTEGFEGVLNLLKDDSVAHLNPLEAVKYK